MACVKFNHHQTKVPHTCPLAHTEIREPKRATINSLSGIIITPHTVPEFVIPRKPPPRLYEKCTAESASDSMPDDVMSNGVPVQSLTHLQVKTTPYGFPFLAESPVTSRKESLYRKRSSRVSDGTIQTIDSLTSSDSMSTSACPTSRSTSPILISKYCIYNKGVPLSSDEQLMETSRTRLNSRIPLVTPSPPILRRTGIECRRPSMPEFGNNIVYGDERIRSRSVRAEQPKKIHQHCMTTRNIARDLGEIHMKLRYNRESECLQVELIKAENLGGNVYTGTINPILKLSLSPEKGHPKYKTTNSKGTRDPQFNQIFLFNNLKPLQLLDLYLKIKVLSKKSNLRRALKIGNIVQPLGFLVNGNSHTITANVRQRSTQTVDQASNLTVSLCLKRKCLIITIIKAEGLASSSFSGSPNPYIDIEVTESIGEELKVRSFQTKVHRGNVSPVIFKEAFSTPLAKSTTENDLTILFVVRDRERIRRDSSIGHVRLGVGATTNKNKGCWRKLFKSLGRSVTMNCDLCSMPMDD